MSFQLMPKTKKVISFYRQGTRVELPPAPEQPARNPYFDEIDQLLGKGMKPEKITKAIDELENSEGLKNYLAQKIGDGEIEKNML